MRILALAAATLMLAAAVSADDTWPAIKSASQKVLWSGPTTQPEGPSPARCSRPTFSPDGRSVAFFVNEPGGARLMLAPVSGEAKAVWQDADGRAACEQLAFAPDGSSLAAIVRPGSGGKKARPAAVFISLKSGGVTSPAVGNDAGYEIAFSADSKLAALATSSGVFVLAPTGDKPPARRVLAGEPTAEEPSPFKGLAFSPNNDFLVAVGQIRPPFTVQGQGPGVVVFLDAPGGPKKVELPVSTPQLVISPDGRQVAGCVWTTSPVGVERPGGLMAWDVTDLAAGKADGRWALDPKRFIAGDHVYPGCIFWLDGKLCCLATELAPEPKQDYRRFGVWQVQPDGQPKRLSIIGPLPKRMWPDPAGRGRIFWRYQSAAGMYLFDERTGACRRFDQAMQTTNWTLSISPDLTRLAVVKDHQVLLHQLAEEK